MKTEWIKGEWLSRTDETELCPGSYKALLLFLLPWVYPSIIFCFSLIYFYPIYLILLHIFCHYCDLRMTEFFLTLRASKTLKLKVSVFMALNF